MVLMVLGLIAVSYFAVVGVVYGPAIRGAGILATVGCVVVIIVFSALVSAVLVVCMCLLLLVGGKCIACVYMENLQYLNTHDTCNLQALSDQVS